MKLSFEAKDILIVFAVFLIIDSLFIHSLVLDYSKFGIGFLDSIIQHWEIGVAILLLIYWKIIK